MLAVDQPLAIGSPTLKVLSSIETLKTAIVAKNSKSLIMDSPVWLNHV